MSVHLVTSGDTMTWYQRGDQDIHLADALDQAGGTAMSVGFARYGAGETNDWTVSYDEALVITKGAFSVRWAGGTVSARADQVIYLRAGTPLEYVADEDTELVYVTHPHWLAATEASPYAAKLDEFTARAHPPRR